MPIIASKYQKPPFPYVNGHAQTVFPSLFRKIKDATYERERFTLSDGDFVDLDWLRSDSRQLIILTHGLEGSSERHYVKETAKLFHQKGWEALAWNCRSCSGEMNRKLRMYNHGDIADLTEIITYANSRKRYDIVVLAGYSMGGNISMKYLGVNGNTIPKNLKASVNFSAPTDLISSVKLLDQPRSWFYSQRFRNKIWKKIQIKAVQYPGVVDLKNYKKVKKWEDFDNFFTAPVNGFEDALSFYHFASAKNFMQGIAIPTLLVNAQNDPILTPECNPIELAETNPNFYLEMPKEGGHVGFTSAKGAYSYMALRGWEFVSERVSF
ncbi:MAG: alpha/beta fold hydrolase [Bacteroidota bacterium]